MTEWVEASEIRKSGAAQRRRDDRVAEAQQRRVDREQKAELAAKAAEARRARRAARWARVWSVLREHGLWVPVIVAPAVLAWSAQAEQGANIYGPVGGLLPVLTESAAWVISFEIQRRVRQGVAVGRARVAMWLVAAASAGLVFLHGVESSLVAAVVMAVVAVAGLAMHQIKVGMDAAAALGIRRRSGLGSRWVWTPLRSARAAYRSAVTGCPVTEVYDSRGGVERTRVRAMQRAAVRQAPGRLHPDGRVTLVQDSAVVTLDGSGWFRRPVLRAVETGERAWVQDVEDWLNDRPQPGGSEGSGTGSHVEDQPEHAGQAEGSASDVSGSEPAGNPPEPEAEPPSELSAGERSEDARKLAEARGLLASGELPPRPTVKDIQSALRCQRQRASRIRRALHDNRGDHAA